MGTKHPVDFVGRTHVPIIIGIIQERYLFSLDNDPGEENNVITSCTEMAEKLEIWLGKCLDKFWLEPRYREKR
jgi:hypothetical protein